MSTKLKLKIVLTWFLFIPLAILNGLARNNIYQQYTGELLAHQISTLIGSAAFIALVYIMLRKQFSNLDKNILVGIGLSWVAMTVGFEFLFGHFIVGHSWKKLFFDYNLLAGRVWILFLIICAFSPLIVKWLYNRKQT